MTNSMTLHDIIPLKITLSIWNHPPAFHELLTEMIQPRISLRNVEMVRLGIILDGSQKWIKFAHRCTLLFKWPEHGPQFKGRFFRVEKGNRFLVVSNRFSSLKALFEGGRGSLAWNHFGNSLSKWRTNLVSPQACYSHWNFNNSVLAGGTWHSKQSN